MHFDGRTADTTAAALRVVVIVLGFERDFSLRLFLLPEGILPSTLRCLFLKPLLRGGIDVSAADWRDRLLPFLSFPMV